jgi:hypothetical protein
MTQRRMGIIEHLRRLWYSTRGELHQVDGKFYQATRHLHADNRFWLMRG